MYARNNFHKDVWIYTEKKPWLDSSCPKIYKDYEAAQTILSGTNP